jgi:hypothetical protein
MPVVVLGLQEPPNAGDVFEWRTVTAMRNGTERRQDERAQYAATDRNQITLDEIFARFEGGRPRRSTSSCATSRLARTVVKSQDLANEEIGVRSCGSHRRHLRIGCDVGLASNAVIIGSLSADKAARYALNSRAWKSATTTSSTR